MIGNLAAIFIEGSGSFVPITDLYCRTFVGMDVECISGHISVQPIWLGFHPVLVPNLYKPY